MNAGGTGKTAVFVDEVDGLFRSRGAGGGGGSEGNEVYRDFKTEFMQAWDGIDGGEGGLIVIGASNRPYDIDEAFLRRMPRSYKIGPPSYKTRLKILESITSDFPTDSSSLGPLARDTEGYSANDLKEVCRIAATNWVEMGEPGGEVGGSVFADALERFTPSAVNSREYATDVREYEGAFGGGVEGVGRLGGLDGRGWQGGEEEQGWVGGAEEEEEEDEEEEEEEGEDGEQEINSSDDEEVLGDFDDEVSDDDE